MTSRWLLVGSVVALASCGGKEGARTDSSTATQASVPSSGSIDLTGAGATFPQPIYNKWFNDYAAKTGVKINYQAIGSGGGIKQLQEQTVDFGASDAPMTDAEIAAAKGGPVMHVPTVIGAVAIIYNLPEVTAPLKLSGELLADIYLNRVRKWNDSRIAALNPGVTLPNKDIIVVHRTEGSGTTYIFTDYLSSVSKAWATGPGKGKDVQWPTGLGGKGNEGVSGQVKQTPNTIGYTELAYAKQNRLATAQLRNAAGNFVEPSAESATAAAAGALQKLPPGSDYRVSIVNSPGPQAYPISSFTWLLIYKNPTDAEKTKKLDAFLKWALTDGENSAAALYYAPLPTELRAQLTARIDSAAAGGAK